MDAQGEEIRVSVPLTLDTVAKIDELAARLKVGRGRMVSLLVEQGIEDNEWIIRFVTSGVMRPVREIVEGWREKKTGKLAGKPA